MRVEGTWTKVLFNPRSEVWLQPSWRYNNASVYTLRSLKDDKNGFDFNETRDKEVIHVCAIKPVEFIESKNKTIFNSGLLPRSWMGSPQYRNWELGSMNSPGLKGPLQHCAWYLADRRYHTDRFYIYRLVGVVAQRSLRYHCTAGCRKVDETKFSPNIRNEIAARMSDEVC